MATSTPFNKLSGGDRFFNSFIDKGDGTTAIQTDATITGDVNVDIDEINAEMKVDSGHDLYEASNVTTDGTWTITFDSISGLNLSKIQGVENKTTGETYTTAGATVTTTSIELNSSNNSGKTEPQGSDVVEIIYRGDSRFDGKATTTKQDDIISELQNITDTDGIKKITDNVNIGDLSAGTQTNDVKITLDGENVTETNSGDIKTAVELIDDAVGTTDSSAPIKNMQVGLRAEYTVPSEVDDGDSVPVWADTFGRQLIAGFSQAVNSLNVSEQAPAELLTLEDTNLSAVTATGAGSTLDASNYNRVSVSYTASSVSTGGTVKLQASNDDSNWVDLDSENISSDGTTGYQGDLNYKYVRTNVTSRTDGTYTTKLMLKR